MHSPTHLPAELSVAVVGSLNRDHILQVERIPLPGETVLAHTTASHRGGKGANQAIASARLGATVALIGKIGADAEGTSYMRALISEGVDIDGVTVAIDAPTGEAFITVADDAENTIVVAPGANDRLSPADVAAAGETLARAAVTLVQLEVPMDAVRAAMALAGGTVVLNPAPARQLGSQLLSGVDVLVPNRGELARLAQADDGGPAGGGPAEGGTAGDNPTGGPGNGAEHPSASVLAHARSLLDVVPAVVVTLGAQGAVLVMREGEPVHVPSPAVTAVDTTGAGDAFCGGLAVALARGDSLPDAVRWAVVVAAAATTRVGAQTGLPTADEVRRVAG